MTGALHPPPERDAAHRKAVLFCPECGHADTLDGAWERDASGTREEFVCPACGSTVIAQPRL